MRGEGRGENQRDEGVGEGRGRGLVGVEKGEIYSSGHGLKQNLNENTSSGRKDRKDKKEEEGWR